MILRRFNRYIVWEITKLFLITLLGFTTIVTVVGVVQQLVTQGLGPWAIVQLTPYVLPISLQFALPGTLLFAVCSVYGRIAADNEIMAVAAVGVPPIRIITPVLILSLLLSLVAVWLNDIAFSWGRPGINRVIMHSIERVVYGVLSTQGSYSTPQGFSIHVHGIGPDGRTLLSPTITTTPSDGNEPISISARSARLAMDPENEVLRIELVDSIIESSNLSSVMPGPAEYEVSLSRATRKGTSSGHPSEFPMRRIRQEVSEEQDRIAQAREILAAHTAMGLAGGRPDWLVDAEASRRVSEIEGGAVRIHRLQAEPWRRWSNGFSCFFFAWVGIPLAIRLRTADHWTSFGACFVPILLIYYPIFMVGADHAKDGSWHPATLWLGNAALACIGALLLRSIHRR
ncbi:MAG: LptF/LptG family permease [Planctomycetota bacterium]|nr:MAG: LptF/LptG family permease [Planctomycetota bacterium]